MKRAQPISQVSVLTLCLVFILSPLVGACSSGSSELENPIKPTQALPLSDGASPGKASSQTALAVSTVSSLISVQDVMVREPERFKKVLCSDSNFYDLSYVDGRFSLAAEPLSVCVLFSDTKDLKPIGICGDAQCAATAVSDCNEAEKSELMKKFAVDQKPQRCWNVGSFAPLSFTVLMSRVGQSCQAQTLAKGPKGWVQLSSIDGTYETRKTEDRDATGCWWEAGASFSFEGDWFGEAKRVAPVMAFSKEGKLYALIRSNWSGTDNYQLFLFEGDKAIEVESFAEALKDLSPSSSLFPTDAPSPSVGTSKSSTAAGKKAKAGKKDKKAKKGKDQAPPVQSPMEAVEAAPEQPAILTPAPDSSDVPQETGLDGATPSSPEAPRAAAPDATNSLDKQLTPASESSVEPAQPGSVPPPSPDEDGGVSPLEGEP